MSAQTASKEDCDTAISFPNLQQRLAAECAATAEFADEIQSTIAEFGQSEAKLSPKATATLQNLDLLTQIFRALSRLHANLASRDVSQPIPHEEIRFLIELDSLSDRLVGKSDPEHEQSKSGDVLFW